MSKTSMPYEVPAEMRDFAEKSVEQAKKAVDGFLGAATKAVSAAESQATTMQVSSRDMAQKAISFAEQNISASFDFAQKLVRAKDIQEVLQVQSEFLKNQVATMQAQMKDVGEVVQANVQKAAADAQTTVQKATAEVQKAAAEATRRK
jgi:phasin